MLEKCKRQLKSMDLADLLPVAIAGVALGIAIRNHRQIVVLNENLFKTVDVTHRIIDILEFGYPL